MVMQHFAVVLHVLYPYLNKQLIPNFWFVQIIFLQTNFSFILQEAALRTFHINDDSTKYCLTVPIDNGINKFDFDYFYFLCIVGSDQPLDEIMPLKSLKQLSDRKLNIYIRYKERGDMDCDYVRVYPGILK